MEMAIKEMTQWGSLSSVNTQSIYWKEASWFYMGPLSASYTTGQVVLHRQPEDTLPSLQTAWTGRTRRGAMDGLLHQRRQKTPSKEQVKKSTTSIRTQRTQSTQSRMCAPAKKMP